MDVCDSFTHLPTDEPLGCFQFGTVSQFGQTLADGSLVYQGFHFSQRNTLALGWSGYMISTLKCCTTLPQWFSKSFPGTKYIISFSSQNRWGKWGSERLSYLPRASLVTQMVRNLPAVQETRVWSLSWEDPREKGMANHSHILAWRIPWKKEPNMLQSRLRD